MSIWKPTAAQIALIRRFALAEASPAISPRNLDLQPGIRRNIDDSTIAESMNIALVAKDGDDGNDTDLADHAAFDDFAKGVPLTPGGAAIVDFYIYDRTDGLCGNVVDHYAGRKMIRAIGGSGYDYLKA